MRIRLRRQLRAGQRGASAVEYALVATLVAVMIIGAVTVFGDRTAALFSTSCRSMADSSGTSC